MAIANGSQLGMAVCKALGLDPSRVQSLVITLEAMGPASVTVERLINDTEAQEIVSQFDTYTLTLKSSFRKSHGQFTDDPEEPQDDASRAARAALAAEEAP